MIINWITSKVVMPRVTSNDLLKSVDKEHLMDFATDFVKLLNVYELYKENVTVLKVENYRAVLPCDIMKLIAVRDNKTKYPYLSTTDIFFDSEDKVELAKTYKVQGSVIYTSNKEGEIEICYQSLNVDEEGFPMIPDTTTFKDALFYYIKNRVFDNLYDVSKISGQVLQKAQQDYSWKVAQASTELKEMNLDQLESISNNWNTHIIRTHAHKSGFRDINKEQRINI